MKTTYISRPLTIGIIAGIISFGNHLSSLAQADVSTIAVSKDGIAYKAPTSLRVAVFSLNNPLKFQICFENSLKGYVQVIIKDEKDNIQKKLIVYSQKFVGNFNMSQMREGAYTVEVINEMEKHRYQILLRSKVLRSVQIKHGTLAQIHR